MFRFESKLIALYAESTSIRATRAQLRPDTGGETGRLGEEEEMIVGLVGRWKHWRMYMAYEM
jgi:hypothetical protein